VTTATEPRRTQGMDRPTFGARLKGRREAKGLSRKDFADRLGVGVRIVESWEQGLRAPKLPQIPLIADLLGCAIDDLLRDDPPAEPRPRRKRKDTA
jgi:transcriptional regulator with XRE-family HTH domain